MKIIAIDGGITTTRVAVFENNKIVAFTKKEVGARQTHLSGSNRALKQVVKELISQALKKAKLKKQQIDYLFASGMITSNLGLYEVPHLNSPVTLEKQAKRVVIKPLKEIFPLSFHFIPGVKCHPKKINLNCLPKVDFMRGEETEIRGVLYLRKITLPAVFILPGSHTKVVLVNEKGAITESTTLITGEIIKAILKETIIGSSLPKNLVTKIEPKFFLKGAKICLKYGLNKSLFCVRLLEQLTKTNPNQCANFFMGGVLEADFSAIRPFLKKAKTVVLGGQKNLRELYRVLFKDKKVGRVTVLPEKIAANASAFGAWQIAQTWAKNQGC